MKTKKLLSALLTIMMFLGTVPAFGISAHAENECFLDLDAATTDILDSRTLDQNYELTVAENKTDLTKVKLSWEIKDINATRTDSKVWDTENLCWTTASSSTKIDQAGSARFTLENYSSVKVDATAAFEALDDEDVTVVFDEATGTDGTITLETANGSTTYSKTNVPTGEITVTVTPSEDYFEEKSATAGAVKYGTYTVTLSEYEDTDNCLAAGTRITMADGSLKSIEAIVEGDEVLTFNHEAGRYEAQKVYLAWAGQAPKRAFTLHFAGGTEISVIGDHCFFEKESLSYAAILESNAEQFLGRHFYNAGTGRYEELLQVTYNEEPVKYYEIYTAYNANCIAEGMLNVAYDSSEMLNIYSFNEDLTIDHDQLAQDIAAFGLFEYVENDRYSREQYDALALKYVNVIIGKGLSTRAECHERMEAFFAD